MAVKPIPDGYHSITPYLTVEDAGKSLEFVRAAFGATEKECMLDENGKVRHAEAVIGNSIIMIGQARDEWSPMPTGLYFYVEDADATYRQALEAGAESIMEPTDVFYGDRNAGVKDPVGNLWWIATHVEDVSPEEMERRAKAHMK